MDVNYILAREQIERVRAGAATNIGARAAHVGMADRYRDMFENHRRAAHQRADAPVTDWPRTA